MKRSFLLLSCLPMLMRAPGGEKETSETAGGVTSTSAVTLSSTFAESRSLSTDAGAAYDPAQDESLVPIEGIHGQTVHVSPESAEHILNKRLAQEIRWEHLNRSVGDYAPLPAAQTPDLLANNSFATVPAAPAAISTEPPKGSETGGEHGTSTSTATKLDAAPGAPAVENANAGNDQTKTATKPSKPGK